MRNSKQGVSQLARQFSRAAITNGSTVAPSAPGTAPTSTPNGSSNAAVTRNRSAQPPSLEPATVSQPMHSQSNIKFPSTGSDPTAEPATALTDNHVLHKADSQQLDSHRSAACYAASSASSSSDFGDTPSQTSDSGNSSFDGDLGGLPRMQRRPQRTPALIIPDQAHVRFTRAFKQVRSQMLITSSILEGSGLEEGHEDDNLLSGSAWHSQLKPVDPLSSQTPSLTPLPLPLRAHARFRTAFNRMRNQMLITSKMVETGGFDTLSVGQLVIRPRSPLAGGHSRRMSTASLASVAEAPEGPKNLEREDEKVLASHPDVKPYFDLSRPRCLSVSVADGSLFLKEDGPDAFDNATSTEEERLQRRNSLAGIPQLPLHHTGIQAGIVRSRRSSSADPHRALEIYLRDELRRLVCTPRSHDIVDNTTSSQEQHAELGSSVARYLEAVPQALATTEGWNLCLEGLYLRGMHEDIDAVLATPRDGSVDGPPYSVQSVYDVMHAADVQLTGRTYSVMIQSLCARAKRAQKVVKTKDASGCEVSEYAQRDHSSVVLALLERALHMLRHAVLQHPAHGTHPDSPAPFVCLLDSFAAIGLPRRVEEVIELWSKSATEAGLTSMDGRAHHALIRAVVLAAEQDTAHGQDPAITHLSAVQKITEVLQTFEQDWQNGILERILPHQAAEGRAAFDLLVYNGAIEASFRLGYPDRGVEIFERILSHRQVAGHCLAHMPLEGSTISALLEGLLLVGEPVTAVNWMIKLRQHNQLVKLTASVEDLTLAHTQGKALPEPSDNIVSRILTNLLDSFPKAICDPADAPSISPSDSEATLRAFLNLLPIIRERAEASPNFLPADLARRISDVLNRAQVSRSETPATQSRAGTRASSLQPQQLSLSQPMTPSFTQGSSASVPHTQADAPMSPPLTPPPVATQALNQPSTRSLPAHLLKPHGVKINHSLRLRKVDAAFSRKFESSLRAKKPRNNIDVAAAGVQAPLKVLRKSVERGIFPDAAALKEMIMACGRANDLASVREVYGVACVLLATLRGGSEAQLQAWCSIEDAVLSSVAHSGDAAAASAHRLRLLSAGGVPSANSYAALIATVKDTTDDAQAARDLWQESRQLGVVPNIYLYNAIISKLSRARKAYPALQLFDEMRRPPHNLQPTSVTYGAIVNACVRGGDAARATKYFAEMESDPGFKPRVPPYNTMIQFFTYAEPQREQALLYYQKMRAAGVQPSAHTYKLLLDIHGTIKPVQPTEMERIFAELRKDSSVKVNGAHWASLIECYGRELQNVSKAIETFERADTSDAHSDPIALEALMLVFFEAHQPHLMRRYVEAMRRAGTRMTAYICNLLIKGFALDGPAGLEEARAIFAMTKDPPTGVAAAGNHAPRVHGTVARQAGTPVGGPSAGSSRRTSGKGAPPLTNGNQAGKAAAPSHGPLGAPSLDQVYREPSTYESMIRAELFHGNVDRARLVLAQMDSRRFPPALILRTRTLFDEPAASVLTVCLKPTPREAHPGQAARGPVPMAVSSAPQPMYAQGNGSPVLSF